MKLRIRSFESKETLKIEAPNSCTLPQLKQILSQTLPNSRSPASIRLSLNRKEELRSDGEDSLHSLGITSGDLIFYSLEQPIAVTSSNPQITLPLNPATTLKSDSTNLNTQNTLPEVHNPDSLILDSHMDVDEEDEQPMAGTSSNPQITPATTLKSDSTNLNAQNTLPEVQNPDSLILDSHMEVDEEDNGNRFDNYGFSVPGFLRKVLVEEMGNDSGRYHKLIVIAVHAVLLESGFVAYDPNAKVVINGFRVSEIWPSRMFTLSLFYTLPEIVTGEISVVLKFLSLGKFINVYGSLSGGKSGKTATHSVRLNEDHLVPFLNVVWANCGVTGNVSSKDGNFSGTSPEKEVFKFWRTVKDNIALPLLIDICEEAALGLPPCFMRLPTDLKLKIFEFLPGVDLERVSCVCSELRYLASDDDLWKIKFAEEFGNEGIEVLGSWRKAYSRAWVRKNDRKRLSGVRGAPYWPEARGIRYRRPPILPRLPHIIGGEHDIWPGFGNNMQTKLHDLGRMIHSPPCNLGGAVSRKFI